MSSHHPTKSSTSRKNVNKDGKNIQMNLKNSHHPGNGQNNVKSQPTPEQMRIANLMNDKTDFNELQTKVDKIIQITGASSDVAVVALHDNDNELDKAIDKILEGVSLNEAEWRKTGKKRKPKNNLNAPQPELPVPKPEEKSNLNGEKKANNNRIKSAQRQRGNLNKTSWKPKGDKHNSNSDNNENIAPQDVNLSGMQPKRNDSRRGRGRGFSRGNYASKGNEKSGRGTRTFQNKGYRSGNEGFSNSIDIWTNSTADQASSNKVASGDCTTMTVGNWSDFAGNEDWSEEDWDSNIMETKVFTPSTKALSKKEDINEMVSNTVSSAQGIHFNSLLGKQSNETSNQSDQQSISSLLGSTSGTSAGVALLQQLQQQSVSSQASRVNKYSLSQYTKQATENIKSLVGIPTTTFNSSNATIIPTANLDNQVSNLSSRSQLQSSNDNQTANSANTKPQRLSGKRSTKIPESAVEMPTADSISSLNVQFGALPFDLGPETSNVFQDVVNHVNSKSNQGVSCGQTAGSSSSLTSASLLNAAVSDNVFKRTDSTTTPNADTKTSNATADLVLQNSVICSQSISEVGLDHNKNSSSYGSKVLDGNRSKSNLYSNVTTTQSQTTNSSDISNYKNAPYPQADASSTYVSSNVSYGAVSTAAPYVYSSSNQTMGAYSTGTNYSSNFQPIATNSGVSTQKVGMNDLDTTGTTQQKHSYDLQNVSNIAAAGSLGLVSNSTVTTNVLKNSLTATGKGIPNVPPGVTPLLGTQYIMGQAGLPAFYPLYDISIPAAHGRDHNFAYSTNTDLKYSRADNDGSSAVSTQSPVVSQTHNQAIFGQLPPGYGFFYTPGVNMMPQSLYGAAAPIFPVTPATNTHGGSTGSAFPKGTSGYGSHSFASTGYDPLAPVPPPSEYVKTNYGPLSGQQQVKGMNTTNTNDLSGSNVIYGKSHTQLNKSYDKSSFQTATPPPFNITPQAGTLGSAYAPTPSQYIPMLPQTQPSMLHHTLQGDASHSGPSGVGPQRSISQTQKGSGTNSSKYYNWG